MFSPNPGALEVCFQSLEDSVPDVVVEPPQRGDHLPIRYLDSLIEKYLHGVAYLCIHARASSELHEGHRACSRLNSLRPDDVEVVRPVGSDQGEVLYRCDGHGHGNLPVLVPVLSFVEQPEGVVIQRVPCGVWCQSTDILARAGPEMLDALIGQENGLVGDREGGNRSPASPSFSGNEPWRGRR